MTGHRAAYDLAGGMADIAITDPGASGTVNVTKCPCVVNFVTAAAESRTIKDPVRDGLWVTLGFQTDGGNLTLSFENTINQAGNNQAVMADAGDVLVLTSIKVGSNYRWRIVANDGASLSS